MPVPGVSPLLAGVAQLVRGAPSASVGLVRAGADVAEAAAAMAARRVGSLLVVSGSGPPPASFASGVRTEDVRGIITERDVLLSVGALRRGPLEVSAVMSREVEMIGTGGTIGDAMRMMAKGQYRHLPVVEEGDTIVGMISVRDIVSLLSAEHARAITKLEREIGRLEVLGMGEG